ncbi:MAG TPA: hypothetical protein VF590_23960 [Isosphaeraceae bacterium]
MPQPYRVACARGHELRGLRTEGYQALRCPTCGEGVFVLPRSPLPESPEPAGRPRRPRPEAAEASFDERPVPLTDPPAHAPNDGDASWVEPEIEVGPAPAEPPEAEGSPTRDRTRRGQPGRGPRAPSRPPSPRRPKPVAAVPAPVAAIPEPVRPGRGDSGPGRRPALVLLAVLGLVVGTIALSVWKQRRSALPRDAEAARVEGLTALDAGEFDRARRLLEPGARAVAALGGEYEGAEAIRQGALEAAIYTDLASEPLEAILEEAARTGDAQWPDRFAARHRGRSVLFETHVAAVPESPGSGAYDLDYRILAPGAGDRPRVARLDLAGFALFEAIKPRLGERLLFGARLADVVLEDGQWLVRLEPGSGVLMTRPGPLEALGWPPPEALDKEDQQP